jgi:hypothetical protein
MLAGLCVAAATAVFAPKAATSPRGVDVSSREHRRGAVIVWPDVAAAGNSDEDYIAWSAMP